jgi:hypothetical protein
MRRVSSTVEINSSPEPIWQLLSEPKRYSDYVTATEKLLSASDDTVKVGSSYREYGGIPPFMSESDWIVTAYEPMTHQHHIGDHGKMRMPLDLDLEVIDDTTSRLTIAFGLEPRWFLAVPFAILWPLILRKRAQKAVDDTVANAKHIVEAGQA